MIYPKLDFYYYDKLRDLVKKDNSPDNNNTKYRKDQIKYISKYIKKEILNNENYIKSLNGKRVLIGDQFFIKKFGTDEYLSVNKTKNENALFKYKLKLNRFPNINMIFVFKLKTNTESDNKFVSYNNSLNLVNENNPDFIISKFINTYLSTINLSTKQFMTIGNIENNNFNEFPNKIYFKSFRPIVNLDKNLELNNICYYDIITIKDNESQYYLTYNDNLELTFGKVPESSNIVLNKFYWFVSHRKLNGSKISFNFNSENNMYVSNSFNLINLENNSEIKMRNGVLFLNKDNEFIDDDDNVNFKFLAHRINSKNSFNYSILYLCANDFFLKTTYNNNEDQSTESRKNENIYFNQTLSKKDISAENNRYDRCIYLEYSKLNLNPLCTLKNNFKVEIIKEDLLEKINIGCSIKNSFLFNKNIVLKNNFDRPIKFITRVVFKILCIYFKDLNIYSKGVFIKSNLKNLKIYKSYDFKKDNIMQDILRESCILDYLFQNLLTAAHEEIESNENNDFLQNQFIYESIAHYFISHSLNLNYSIFYLKELTYFLLNSIENQSNDDLINFLIKIFYKDFNVVNNLLNPTILENILNLSISNVKIGIFFESIIKKKNKYLKTVTKNIFKLIDETKFDLKKYKISIKDTNVIFYDKINKIQIDIYSSNTQKRLFLNYLNIIYLIFKNNKENDYFDIIKSKYPIEAIIMTLSNKSIDGVVFLTFLNLYQLLIKNSLNYPNFNVFYQDCEFKFNFLDFEIRDCNNLIKIMEKIQENLIILKFDYRLFFEIIKFINKRFYDVWNISKEFIDFITYFLQTNFEHIKVSFVNTIYEEDIFKVLNNLYSKILYFQIIKKIVFLFNKINESLDDLKNKDEIYSDIEYPELNTFLIPIDSIIDQTIKINRFYNNTNITISKTNSEFLNTLYKSLLEYKRDSSKNINNIFSYYFKVDSKFVNIFKKIIIIYEDDQFKFYECLNNIADKVQEIVFNLPFFETIFENNNIKLLKNEFKNLFEAIITYLFLSTYGNIENSIKMIESFTTKLHENKRKISKKIDLLFKINNIKFDNKFNNECINIKIIYLMYKVYLQKEELVNSNNLINKIVKLLNKLHFVMFTFKNTLKEYSKLIKATDFEKLLTSNNFKYQNLRFIYIFFNNNTYVFQKKTTLCVSVLNYIYQILIKEPDLCELNLILIILTVLMSIKNIIILDFKNEILKILNKKFLKNDNKTSLMIVIKNQYLINLNKEEGRINTFLNSNNDIILMFDNYHNNFCLLINIYNNLNSQIYLENRKEIFLLINMDECLLFLKSMKSDNYTYMYCKNLIVSYLNLYMKEMACLKSIKSHLLILDYIQYIFDEFLFNKTLVSKDIGFAMDDYFVLHVNKNMYNNNLNDLLEKLFDLIIIGKLNQNIINKSLIFSKFNIETDSTEINIINKKKIEYLFYGMNSSKKYIYNNSKELNINNKIMMKPKIKKTISKKPIFYDLLNYLEKIKSENIDNKNNVFQFFTNLFDFNSYLEILQSYNKSELRSIFKHSFTFYIQLIKDLLEKLLDSNDNIDNSEINSNLTSNMFNILYVIYKNINSYESKKLIINIINQNLKQLILRANEFNFKLIINDNLFMLIFEDFYNISINVNRYQKFSNIDLDKAYKINKSSNKIHFILINNNMDYKQILESTIELIKILSKCKNHVELIKSNIKYQNKKINLLECCKLLLNEKVFFLLNKKKLIINIFKIFINVFELEYEKNENILDQFLIIETSLGLLNLLEKYLQTFLEFEDIDMIIYTNSYMHSIISFLYKILLNSSKINKIKYLFKYKDLLLLSNIFNLLCYVYLSLFVHNKSNKKIHDSFSTLFEENPVEIFPNKVQKLFKMFFLIVKVKNELKFNQINYTTKNLIPDDIYLFFKNNSDTVEIQVHNEINQNIKFIKHPIICFIKKELKIEIFQDCLYKYKFKKLKKYLKYFEFINLFVFNEHYVNSYLNKFFYIDKIIHLLENTYFCFLILINLIFFIFDVRNLINNQFEYIIYKSDSNKLIYYFGLFRYLYSIILFVYVLLWSIRNNKFILIKNILRKMYKSNKGKVNVWKNKKIPNFYDNNYIKSSIESIYNIEIKYPSELNLYTLYFLFKDNKFLCIIKIFILSLLSIFYNTNFFNFVALYISLIASLLDLF